MIAPAEVSATQQLAEFCERIDLEELHDAVVWKAKSAILDILGLMVAGSSEAAAVKAAGWAGAQGGGNSTLFANGESSNAAFASLANGVAAHVLDFDDYHMSLPGHPTAVIVPALLALHEDGGKLSGRELIEAYVAGVEAACFVGRGVAPFHYAQGWHSTGTIGSFGSAVACARVLGLAPGEVAHAIGLTASQASGIKGTFGTMTKSFQAGHAAMSGLVGAQLAAQGFTSGLDILEHPLGFDRIYTAHQLESKGSDADTRGEVPGGFDTVNLIFKYHASCSFTHASLESLALLLQRAEIDLADLEELRITVPSIAIDSCKYPIPSTELQAKFSLPGTAAMALTGADTGSLSAFHESDFDDAEFLSICRAVEVVADDGMPPTATRVEARHNSGSVSSAYVDEADRDDDPATEWSRIETKYRSVTSGLLDRETSDRLINAVSTLEDQDDISALITPQGPGGS